MAVRRHALFDTTDLDIGSRDTVCRLMAVYSVSDVICTINVSSPRMFLEDGNISVGLWTRPGDL